MTQAQLRETVFPLTLFTLYILYLRTQPAVEDDSEQTALLPVVTAFAVCTKCHTVHGTADGVFKTHSLSSAVPLHFETLSRLYFSNYKPMLLLPDEIPAIHVSSGTF